MSYFAFAFAAMQVVVIGRKPVCCCARSIAAVSIRYAGTGKRVARFELLMKYEGVGPCVMMFDGAPVRSGLSFALLPLDKEYVKRLATLR